MPARGRGRRFSLVARIYAAGVALVAISALVAWGSAHLVWLESMPPHAEGRFTRFVAETVARDPDPAAAAERVSRALELSITMRDRDGRVLALAGPGAAEATERDGAEAHRRTITLEDGRSVVVAYHRRPHSPLPWLSGVIAALLVIAVAARLASGWLTRPLAKLGRTARAIAAGDLTQRTGISVEHEIGDAAAAFDRMADRVEQLLRSQRELLASVSHELRTPLARIRVALDLASEASDAESARSELVGLEQDLAELELLVSDLLASARDDASRTELPLRREPTTLADVAEKARARFGERHPQRVVASTVDPGAAAETTELDPRLLRRAIENVLDNAHKYSDPESPIRMSLRAEDGATLVEIADEGIGIAVEDRAHVFAPFFRADRPEVRASSGLGLGLALARRIVEAHGGRVAIESALGEGTTVRITIPSGRGAPPA